jgi:hypothetical protein
MWGAFIDIILLNAHNNPMKEHSFRGGR